MQGDGYLTVELAQRSLDTKQAADLSLRKRFSSNFEGGASATLKVKVVFEIQG